MGNSALNEKVYWLHAIAPLHIGAGRGVGYIDLPIAREKATNWPYVPGSAVKGVIADKWSATDENRKQNAEFAAAFGRANQDSDTLADANAGSLVFSDASIVCLPVRSFYGTYAWITSPLALKRLRCPEIPGNIPVPPGESVFVLEGNKVSSNATAYFEDIDLEVDTNKQNDSTLVSVCGLLANSIFTDDTEWQEIFKQRFAVVNDDIFTFLCDTGTSVDARIRIDDATKIVADGALWYEESLPIDTILAGVVWCDKVYAKELTAQELLGKFCSSPLDLQIGGKASTGKGRVRCIFSGGRE
ncbi:type III-B CRISPR module RAMP protein Cmr4 [Synergistales bacterium]|nr:type III-B CRISPR module RAMP protein Cmr4 [Synergistales bacterium]